MLEEQLKLCRTQLTVLEQMSQSEKRKDRCTPFDLLLKSSIKGEPKGPLSIIPYVNSVFIIYEYTIIIPGIGAPFTVCLRAPCNKSLNYKIKKISAPF